MNAVVVAVGGALVVACLVWKARSTRRISRAVAFLLRVDPLAPGGRLSEPAATGDPLAAAIDDLLSRMESDRRTSARHQIAEREEERAAISRELHDEIGQLLTAALLQLDQVEAHPDDPRPLAAAREATAAAFEGVRALSRRVQPLVAPDLDPADALSAMAGSIVRRAGSELVLDVDPTALETLAPHQRVVTFRVARSALMTAVSANGKAPIQLRVLQQWPLVAVEVSWMQNGTPLPPEPSRKLREWALAAHGHIEISAHSRGGCDLVLTMRPDNGSRSPS